MARRQGPSDYWRYDVASGLTVVARRGEHEVASVSLVLDPDAPSVAFRARQVVWSGGGENLSPTFDVAAVEQWASMTGNALLLLDLRTERDDGAELDVVLPHVHATGRKPDSFYKRVIAAKRICEEHGVPYARKLAEANGVSEHGVYRWVTEAKRRGLA